jgi:hypothetical protein
MGLTLIFLILFGALIVHNLSKYNYYYAYNSHNNKFLTSALFTEMRRDKYRIHGYEYEMHTAQAIRQDKGDVRYELRRNNPTGIWSFAYGKVLNGKVSDTEKIRLVAYFPDGDKWFGTKKTPHYAQIQAWKSKLENEYFEKAPRPVINLQYIYNFVVKYAIHIIYRAPEGLF